MLSHGQTMLSYFFSVADFSWPPKYATAAPTILNALQPYITLTTAYSTNSLIIQYSFDSHRLYFLCIRHSILFHGPYSVIMRFQWSFKIQNGIFSAVYNRAYPSLHSFGRVHWVPVLSNFSSIPTLPAFRKRLNYHFFLVPFPVFPHHPLSSCFVMSTHPQIRGQTHPTA